MDWRLGILLVLPFMIAFGWAPGNWPFSADGSIDPWLYYGYYGDLSAHFQDFGAQYYSTRLAHILPGYVIYSWFEPVTANYVLHFAWYSLAVLSLYYILSSIVSKNTAFWAALFMGLDPWFLYSLGEDITDGTSIAYGLGSAALLVCAAKARRWTGLMVLAGLLFAGAINAHTFGLTYLPILFLTFLYLNHEHRRHSVWLGSVLFAGGVLLGTAVFAMVFAELSAQHNIYQVLVDIVQQTVDDPKNKFAEPFSLAYLPASFYLHAITALWLLSAFLLFKTKGEISGPAAYWSSPKTRPYGFCLTLCFIYGLIVLTIEFGLNISLLAFYYYSSFCIPLAYIGLAGALERCSFQNERYHKLAAALLLTALTLFSFSIVENSFVYLLKENYLWVILIFWMACLALLIQWPVIQKTQYARRAVIALLLFAAFFLTGPDNPVWKYNRNYEADNTGVYFFNKVNEGIEKVQSETRDARFWYAEDDPNYRLYTSIASLRMWGYRMISEKMPEIHFTKDLLGKDIVMLSANANAYAKRVMPTLKAKGLKADLLTQKQMTFQGRDVYMTFIRLVDWGLPVSNFKNQKALWSADREFLQANLKKHVYGKISRKETLKSDGETLVFYPGTPKDHLASIFIDTKFTDPKKEYWIKLKMVYPPHSKPSSACVFYVQSRKFERLYQAPCANPFLEKPDATEEKYFKVSGDIKQIRLVFQSRESLEPTQIPNAIRLDRMEVAPS